MKYNEYKFQELVIAHLLKIGATFERYAGCGYKAKYYGAEFTFFNLKETDKTDVHFVACRNTEGKKQNFTSIYSRAESLDLFKQHIADLFGAIDSFGYVFSNGDIVRGNGHFWSYSQAANGLKMFGRINKLKNGRLYLILESGKKIYLS